MRSIKQRLSVSVFNKLFPHASYTTTKAVHVSKRPHCIGDYRVPIIVFVGEVVTIDTSIQPSRVEDLKPVGELIEHSRTGTPYFQLHDRETSGELCFCSSNYELYGDMSRRIISILREV